jgi:chromosome segregation ATPase
MVHQNHCNCTGASFNRRVPLRRDRFPHGQCYGSRSALNALEDQADDLAQKKQEIQAEINSLEYEQSSAMAKKEVLDEQIELTQEEIENTNEQITEYTQLIAEKEVEVTEAQIAEDEQFELYKTRMRAMEENGTISYIAVISRQAVLRTFWGASILSAKSWSSTKTSISSLKKRKKPPLRQRTTWRTPRRTRRTLRRICLSGRMNSTNR